MLMIYSVFDSKISAFMNPIFLRNSGEAIRVFESAVLDEKHDFHRYASDFTLFELGSWDDQSAKFDLYSTPKSLGVAIQFLKSNVSPMVYDPNLTKASGT